MSSPKSTDALPPPYSPAVPRTPNQIFAFPVKNGMEDNAARLAVFLFAQGWRSFPDIMLHIAFAVGTPSFAEMILWRKVAVRHLTLAQRKELRGGAIEWEPAPANVEVFLRTRKGLGVVDMGPYHIRRAEERFAKGPGKEEDRKSTLKWKGKEKGM